MRAFRAVQCSGVVDEQDARPRTAFHELASTAKVQTVLRLNRVCSTSLGLVAGSRVARGEVLMRVPKSAAILLDYNTGLSLPASASWPRLRGAAAESAEPLPWDILQALALVDGLAGDGGEFWHHYCDALLPAPEQLTLPMCWEEPRLAQLQHADIAQAAVAQQARLRALLPELMEPLAPDVPSWLQWAFACVRSRAFKAGPDAFAFVPFLDFANHAEAPTAPPTTPGSSAAAGPAGRATANADFRFGPTSASERAAADAAVRTGRVSSSDGSSTGGESFELVAVRDIAEGEEVTICYSGPEGYTNQRFMAQYGFVPEGGNPADRIKLQLPPDSLTAAPLELARLQDLLGDAMFLAALRGTDPYLAAALKSLPLTDGGEDAAGAASRGCGGDAGARTAAVLLGQVESQIAEGTTRLEEDEEMLAGAVGEELWALDPRHAAAIRYRLERKRLLGTGAALLRAYVRSCERRT